jgi:hypothetical protein
VHPQALIVVRTANRPEVLQRCLHAAVEGCEVARRAQWFVLDDSSPENVPRTRGVVRSWKQSGLLMAYADKTIEQQLAEALPEPQFRDAFTRLVARSATCPGATGRNLGLLAGFSLQPEVLYFLDDDMVHRHEGTCFFHWCANSPRSDSFIAAPRKLGIVDMTYLHRLALIFELDEWRRFISAAGIAADPEWWCSTKNPFWKEKHEEDAASSESTVEREVINGGIMALHNNGGEWFPFPNGYNEDLNWSLLQAACFGTELLKVGGIDVHHLPPRISHPEAETILSELIGAATTRAVRAIRPHCEHSLETLATKLPEVLHAELKQGLFLLVDVELAVRSRARHCDGDVGDTLAKIVSTLTDVGERLKSIDSREVAGEWLKDFTTRRSMFNELRRNDVVQARIRGTLFETGA